MDRSDYYVLFPLHFSIRSKSYMSKHCPASCESLQQQQQQLQNQATETSQGAAATATSVECVDKHPHCSQWAALGECTENMDVRNHCAKSCLDCDSDCTDTHVNCKFWADAGECEVSER